MLSAGRPHSKEGKPTSSGPESGELAREAASQAPGPVLLTFSHPTPPRSCLHFRPEAVGSAKRLELALLERCRTPTPLLPHHPFKRVCGKGFSHCPPPSPPKGHHPREYTPVQGDLSQFLYASVSLHATATQHCHGWEHQKALWTLSAAKDKAPEPNISGRHLLVPLPSKHQPALVPSPALNSTGPDPNSHHSRDKIPWPGSTDTPKQVPGQDSLTPLNPPSPQPTKIRHPEKMEALQQGWRGNEHPAPAEHSMDPSPAPAQSPAQAPEPKLVRRRHRMAPRPWETSAEEEMEPDGKVSATEWDGNEWVSEGH